MGDYNARTSVLTDVTETDTDIYNHIDIDPDEVFSTDNVKISISLSNIC